MAAKTKTYAVLNNVLYGTGLKHRFLRPGDTIELDPDGDDRETVLELLAKDYLEDPERPKERTPEQKMALERRQIAGKALVGPPSSAVRREQADVARVERLETALVAGRPLTPEGDAEARALALEKAEDESIGLGHRRAVGR